MVAKPTRLADPHITLTGAGTTPVAVQFKCYSKGIHLVPETDDAAATFCDPLGFKWVLTLDLLQSVGDDGLDEALWSLGGPGTVCDFDFAFYDDAITPPGEDNPHWTGSARLGAWSVVDAGINETTEINLEMTVIGDVTKEPAPTPPVALAENAA